MEKQLSFYDIECFSNDSLIVFKNINNEIELALWNDFEQVADYIKDKQLVGYNNHYYDDLMLTLMMRGVNNKILKRNNDLIISGQDTGVRIDAALIDSLDCFQQISVSRPGLKKIEGNMGKMIKESSVPFDIDRPLTEEEKKEVLKYCAYDVKNTIEVYKLREHSYFEAKSRLLEMCQDVSSRWNTTTITSQLLYSGGSLWSDVRVPEQMWNDEDIPDEVWKMWNQVRTLAPEPELKIKSRTIKDLGCKIQFGFGGLHGAVDEPIYLDKQVTNVDVTSLYPSIVINLKVLGEKTEFYKGIKEWRVKVKHKDKSLSDALKLVLNSTYGLLKSKYSKLYNPKAATTVCIYGQIILFKLCKQLYDAGCELININTDGVAFIDHGVDYQAIIENWQKEYNLNLEEDHFEKWIQKDVNNYIAVSNGKLKAKGGEVKRYNKDSYFENNNARIIDICIVDYLVYKKDIIENLNEHLNEPKLFQYILRAGNTYLGVFDKQGNRYNKINRVFACKPEAANEKLYKKRSDGGLVNFPDVPENMKLWNDSCDDIQNIEEWIDLNHYYQIIKKKLSRWKGDAANVY